MFTGLKVPEMNLAVQVNAERLQETNLNTHRCQGAHRLTLV